MAADIIVVLDSSASMKSDYEKEKKLVEALIEQFQVGQSKVRIGLVVFGSYAKTHSTFDDTKSTSTAKAALENAPFIGGNSRLDLGLNQAYQLFQGNEVLSDIK